MTGEEERSGHGVDMERENRNKKREVFVSCPCRLLFFSPSLSLSSLSQLSFFSSFGFSLLREARDSAVRHF